MLYRDISRTLSTFLLGLTLPLLLPLAIAVYCEKIAGPEIYPQPPSAFAFFATIVITIFLALLFRFLGAKSTGQLFRREAILLVVLFYFVTGVIGGLPFYLNRTFTNPIDAFFETVSGVTTTGISVMQSKEYDKTTGEEVPIKQIFQCGARQMYSFFGTIAPVKNKITGEILYTGIEAVSPALLFWRSMTQWLGGCGIVVLFVAILPALGVGGKILFQTEVTGPTKESLVPRIKETASLLWKIYLGLTALEVFFLMVTNHKMSLFDAITVTFSTLSTGGFAPTNNNIGSYDNVATDIVVMIFMILGAINFSLYFFLWRGKFRKLNDPELKTFLLILLFSSLFAGWLLYGTTLKLLTGEHSTFTFGEALLHGAFQVISAQTTTGFVTVDFDIWPFPVLTLMLILMYIAGMAGSTSGGIKVIRLRMLWRIIIDKIESIFHPDTVRIYRVGTTAIDDRTAMSVLCFFMVSIGLSIIAVFLLILDGVDPETSLSAVACCINNIGLSFRMGGPTNSFAFLSNWSKIITAFIMIAGRLEFFALLLIFVPAFWRSK